MRLHLVRHGEASTAYDDPHRPLTAHGRDQIARLAQWCAAHSVAPAEIRHSGLLRAAETAEILAARLAPPGGVRAVRGIAPEDEAFPLVDELLLEPGPLMIVTHMPFVAHLASLLLANSLHAPMSFSTGTIACMEGDRGGFVLLETFTP